MVFLGNDIHGLLLLWLFITVPVDGSWAGRVVELNIPEHEYMSLGGSGGGGFSWYSLTERLKFGGDIAFLRRTGGGVVMLIWNFWSVCCNLISLWTYCYWITLHYSINPMTSPLWCWNIHDYETYTARILAISLIDESTFHSNRELNLFLRTEGQVVCQRESSIYPMQL